MTEEKNVVFSLAEMGKKSHSRHVDPSWEILQPDGSKTRSFKNAQIGSTVELEFVYGDVDAPLTFLHIETEFFKKTEDGWVLTSSLENDEFFKN